MNVSVYFLCEPDSEVIRYVGYTSMPTRRLAGHVASALKYQRNTHKDNWIRSLARDGKQPVMKITRVVASVDEAKQLEIAFIADLQASGHRLTNATLGGDGTTGCRALRGRKLTLSHRQKVGSAVRKAYASREARAAISMRVSASWTPERRAAHSRKKREHFQSAIVRAQHRDAQKAFYAIPGARKAQSLRMKTWWADRKRNHAQVG